MFFNFFLPLLLVVLFCWFAFDVLKREQMRHVHYTLNSTKDNKERAGKYLPSVNDMATNWSYWHLWTVKQWIRWADRQQGKS